MGGFTLGPWSAPEDRDTFIDEPPGGDRPPSDDGTDGGGGGGGGGTPDDVWQIINNRLIQLGKVPSRSISLVDVRTDVMKVLEQAALPFILSMLRSPLGTFGSLFPQGSVPDAVPFGNPALDRFNTIGINDLFSVPNTFQPPPPDQPPPRPDLPLPPILPPLPPGEPPPPIFTQPAEGTPTTSTWPEHIPFEPWPANQQYPYPGFAVGIKPEWLHENFFAGLPNATLPWEEAANYLQQIATDIFGGVDESTNSPTFMAGWAGPILENKDPSFFYSPQYMPSEFIGPQTRFMHAIASGVLSGKLPDPMYMTSLVNTLRGQTPASNTLLPTASDATKAYFQRLLDYINQNYAEYLTP